MHYAGTIRIAHAVELFRPFRDRGRTVTHARQGCSEENPC